MTVSQTDVHSERIDEPTLSEVWLRDVEIACYSSVLRGWTSWICISGTHL